MWHLTSEIYSPPKATAATKQPANQEIAPGFASDLSTADDEGRHWDFDMPETRTKASVLFEDALPMLLVRPPECSASHS